MPRKTPRPIEEARAIARALRKRYITPEVEATARRAMLRLKIPLPALLGIGVAAPSLEPEKDGPTLITLIREREGIELSTSTETGDFTVNEEAQARAFLSHLAKRFDRKV